MAITAAAFALTACGGTDWTDEPSTSRANTATGGTKQPACSLVPASLVGSSLGLTVGEATETTNSVVTVCDYKITTGGSGTVTVRFQTRADEAGFARGRKGFADSGQPVKDVPGFFDQAYSSTLGSGKIAVYTLVARRGDTEILVTSHATIDKEQALITAVFGLL
jgi:hypothetical protein